MESGCSLYALSYLSLEYGIWYLVLCPRDGDGDGMAMEMAVAMEEPEAKSKSHSNSTEQTRAERAGKRSLYFVFYKIGVHKKSFRLSRHCAFSLSSPSSLYIKPN